MALARIARSGFRRSGGAIGGYSLLNNTFYEGVPTFKYSSPSLENVSPHGNLSYLYNITKASSFGNWSRGIRTTPHFQFQNAERVVEESESEYGETRYAGLEATKPAEMANVGKIPERNFDGTNTEIVQPLSPHLPIYKPQLTSMSSTFNRISGAFLGSMVLFSYLHLKTGLTSFAYENFCQFLFCSSEPIPISAESGGMPQLDKFTYFSQFSWLCLFFFTYYIAIWNNGDGVIGISRILKLRNELVSRQANNSLRPGSNPMEDILRKGFSTGQSYMHSSLLEVSQWCKDVSLKGKLRNISFLSSMGEISASRGMFRKILGEISGSQGALSYHLYILKMQESLRK